MVRQPQRTQELDTVKYLMLIHQTTTREDVAAMSDDDKKALFAAWKQINETPGVTPGERMSAPDNATTVRVQDGETLVTDGPYAEIKDAVAGYLFYEADDLDAALELAARIPAAKSGAIEVRPIQAGWG
jgi:hypothetical protein